MARTLTRSTAAEPVADDLMATLSSLRRAVRRRVRRDWPHRPLPESEVELLRLVRERPGIRVQDAAAGLGVAANTVSTLVRHLLDRGLLVRDADPDDGRAARLSLSAGALARIADWRDRRQRIVSAAFEALPADERRAIVAALPGLHHLADRLGED
jgi:DNA-binding MarR family transcriptional regulator